MNSNPLCISLIFVLFFITNTNESLAQDFSRIDIPFIKDGTVLQNALAGGLRAGQFSQIDLNNDGKKDIVAFDRGSGKIIPFLNMGDFGEINYQFAPAYIKQFPEVQSWFLLRDYNNDGIEDIFTGFSNGIRIYKASRVDDTHLSFEIINFNMIGGFPSLLPLPNGSNFTQLPAETTDIPVIEDLDADGDLDILAFETGGSYVHFYKNMTEERFLPKDTLVYVLEDRCWGKFFESGVSEDVTLSEDCITCATFDGKHVQHAGSTLCAFDGDGDGDFDLLVGDLSNEHMVYMTNGGNKNEACVSNQDIRFPSYDTPIEMFIFNSAFYLDVNNDGKRDLIATTNNRDAKNVDHIWLYVNEGEDNAPEFRLSRTNLFMDGMFSVGSNSSPAFWDYNNDGLMDLLVGSAGKIRSGNDKTGSLELWLNTGSKEVPEFTLENDDFLDYKSFSNNGTNFSPAIGDIDSDGDYDLFVGEVNGQLYFHRNMAGEGALPDFEARSFPFANIFIGQSAKPSIADIDQDGQNDLIIGEGSRNFVNGFFGSLNYFKNFGMDGMENFSDQATSALLYGFLSGSQAQSFYNTAPVYVEHPDNDYYFFSGSDKGEIYALTDVTNNVNGPTTVISDDLGNLELGRRSAPAFADIDNDGFLEMIVGTARGGLEAFNTDLKAKGPVSNNEPSISQSISIFPNPSVGFITIDGINENIETVKLTNVEGSQFSIPIGNLNQVDISSYPSGVYIIEVMTEDFKYITKLVKL